MHFYNIPKDKIYIDIYTENENENEYFIYTR